MNPTAGAAVMGAAGLGIKIVKGAESAADAARVAAKAELYAAKNASELKSIFGWGDGLEGIQNARGALDAAAVARIQGSISRAEVEAAKRMYEAAAVTGKGGAVAPERAAYMQQILDRWK